VEISRDDVLRGITFPIRIALGAPDLSRLLGIQEEVVAEAEASISIDLRVLSQWMVMDTVTFNLNRQFSQLRINVLSGSVGRMGSSTLLPQLQEEETLNRIVRQQVKLQGLAVLRNALAFPAERKALTLVYKRFRGSYETSVGIPLLDFAQFLGFAEFLGTTPRGDQPSASFLPVTSMLEERILKGRLKFAGDPPDALLRYAPEDGPKLLSMQGSASLVRALTGLELYLQYLATAGDFLVIDEPEMNAHPAAQLAIIELLALLVNRGVNLIITTHSPYIADHLQNLIRATRLSPEKQKQIAAQFALGTRDAFLNEDKVSAYQFGEDGEVRDISDRAKGTIDWSTFGNASDHVANLYAQILEASEEE
jgi:hypothetical protein